MMFTVCSIAWYLLSDGIWQSEFYNPCGNFADSQLVPYSVLRCHLNYEIQALNCLSPGLQLAGCWTLSLFWVGQKPCKTTKLPWKITEQNMTIKIPWKIVDQTIKWKATKLTWQKIENNQRQRKTMKQHETIFLESWETSKKTTKPLAMGNP